MAGVMKPDIMSTLVAGLAASTRSASSSPFILGMTTSVSRRWMVRDVAIRRASSGSAVSSTV